MASYLPPTETLPIFDNTVFASNYTDALTYATAKKYFITYPSAQGTSTITDLIAGAISYLSPASGSFFDIGSNQISGGTIRIGPTGGSAGVSVHCGNIDFKNNTINNATSGTTGNINLGDSQTSGVINIGTGARVLSGNGGAINIGTNASNSAPINIGGVNTSATATPTSTSSSTISLDGQNLWAIFTNELSLRAAGVVTLSSANSANVNIATESSSDVYIGPSGSTKNVNLRPNLVLSLPITLPTTAVTPTITQLGYTNSVSNSAIVSISANTLTDLLTTGTVLPLGTLLVTFNVTVTFTPATNASYMTFSFNLSSGTAMVGVPANAIMTLTGAPAKSTFTYTVPVTTTATANNAEIQFRGTTPVGTTASIPIGLARISWIKIA